MNIQNLRRSLILGSRISILDLIHVDINSLCDESLQVYFSHCLTCGLYEQALISGKLLDKYSLPRRGNIQDNSADSFLTVRAARVNRT